MPPSGGLHAAADDHDDEDEGEDDLPGERLKVGAGRLRHPERRADERQPENASPDDGAARGGRPAGSGQNARARYSEEQMIVAASPWLASFAPRMRQVILVLAALFVAHDAIYIARFGWGDGYTRAMSAQGHDAYWAPVSILLTAGAALVALATLATFRRLRADAGTVAVSATTGSAYSHELASIWVRLFPSVAVLFVFQENLEHLAVDGHLAGLQPLIGPGSSIVLPVLAATTFVLAAVGASVRWRIRVLEARVAAAVRLRFALAPVISRPAGWDTVAAAIAHGLMLSRRDAGRAPPSNLQTYAVPTA
jgi:hypothetical protein